MSCRAMGFSSFAVFFLFAAPLADADGWNFEGQSRLTGWTRTGSAFTYQPTFGDNVAVREPGTTANLEGNHWIGTFEYRPAPELPAGAVQGDAPQGTLTSDLFEVRGAAISFLIGGGRDLATERVELLVRSTAANRRRFENVRAPDGNLYSYPAVALTDGSYFQIHASSGRNDDRMERVTWPVRELVGELARIRIVDASSAEWGHVNVDDFRFEGVAGSRPGDLIATGMEITQAVQVYPGNGVPLVAYKPTLVRVYVTAQGDGIRWDDVTGTLTVRNAVTGATIGRSIPAIGAPSRWVVASVSGSRREVLDDTVNFLLDASQTSPGDKVFDVTVTSFQRRAESTLANNSLSQRMRFESIPGMEFYALTFGYSNEPVMAAPPLSEFAPHRVWAQQSLPIPSLQERPYPGSPVGDFAHRHVQNYVEGTSADVGYVDARNWAASLIDRQSPGGGSWVVLMQPEIDPSYHGAHFITLYGNHCINMQRSFHDSGPTLAHEIGHGWDQPHTFESGVFPHADGRAGPQVGIRIGRDGFQVFDGAFDVMSYTSPFWVSPHTYTEILRSMTRDRVAVPRSVREARVAPRDRVRDPGRSALVLAKCEAPDVVAAEGLLWIYVSGSVAPDGAVHLYPFETFSLAVDPPPVQDKGFSLVFEGGGGEAIGKTDFAPSIPSCDPDKTGGAFFGVYAPYPAGVRRIVIQREGKEVASRTVSANAPTAALDGFEGGAVTIGKQPVTWRAQDADGDVLSASLWYSPSSGVTWTPIQVWVRTSRVDVDFSTLPGSDSAMLRVLVSDGVNTVEARTPTFSVPNKAPVVRLDLASPKGPLVRLQASNERPLVLSADVFDAEDGRLLEPSSIRWTSDRDGALGTGSWVVLRALSPGKHRVTAHATDSSNLEGTASVEVESAGAPKALVLVLDGVTDVDAVGATLLGRVSASADLTPGLRVRDASGRMVFEAKVDVDRASGGTVRHRVEGLTPATAYEAVLVAWGREGEHAGPPFRFRTLARGPDPVVPPVPAGARFGVQEVTGLTPTGATIVGWATGLAPGSRISVRVVSKEQQVEFDGPVSAAPVPGRAELSLRAVATGLRPSTPYVAYFVNDSLGGELPSKPHSFVTPAELRSSAVDVSLRVVGTADLAGPSATLFGEVRAPEGTPVSFRIAERGGKPLFDVPATVEKGTLAERALVRGSVKGLSPGAVYVVTLVARLPDGERIGPSFQLAMPRK